MMRFRQYDSLRTFDVAARHMSLSRAAAELNLTKGAISYQIAQLERELGFDVFIRGHRSIELTERGQALWHASQTAFRDLELEITRLREDHTSMVTIGVATYFASRWLTPRLMNFMSEYPEISLRIQPLLDMSDLKIEDLDIAIRWGDGEWDDLQIERLFLCPVFPTASTDTLKRIAENGLPDELPKLTLLQDHEESIAWRAWHRAAGLRYRRIRSTLVIPDPNVRVQATIHGQGLALNDLLAAQELDSGTLHRISEVSLDDYGYFLAYRKGAIAVPAVKAFRDWLHGEAEEFEASVL